MKNSFLLIKTIETCFDHNSAKSTIRAILQKLCITTHSLDSLVLIWNASDTITSTLQKSKTAAPESAPRPRER